MCIGTCENQIGAQSTMMSLLDERRPIDGEAFREAMSYLGAAVSVITATGPDGDIGFTASAVCSVTDAPPMLLVCINRENRHSGYIKAVGSLCVNVLAAEHEALSRAFAGGSLTMYERFGLARWRRRLTGARVLENAPVSFECEIQQATEVGTHSVLFCGIQAIHFGASGTALIYHRRQYRSVGSQG